MKSPENALDTPFTLRRVSSSRLRLTVSSSGKLILYCPKRYPKSKCTEFVEKNAERLLREHEKRKKQGICELFGGQDPLSEAASLPYLGKRYPIVRTEIPNALFDGTHFIFPKTFGEHDMLNAYREFLRARAKALLPEICKSIAEANGFDYNKIYVKNISSRWGSCSSSKNLNFSLALIACSDEFIRYVVSHELSHTVHLDHSKDFYKTLEGISPIPLSEVKMTAKQYSHIICTVCRD